MSNYLRRGAFGTVSRHIQCRESKNFNVLLERTFFILWCFLHCDLYPSLKTKPINRFTGWWFLHQHQTKYGFFVMISEPLVMILSMYMSYVSLCVLEREKEKETGRWRWKEWDCFVYKLGSSVSLGPNFLVLFYFSSLPYHIV